MKNCIPPGQLLDQAESNPYKRTLLRPNIYMPVCIVLCVLQIFYNNQQSRRGILPSNNNGKSVSFIDV